MVKGLVLVTGSEGLVGSRFLEISECKDFLYSPKQSQMDITNPSEVKSHFRKYNFETIVNFAAFTDVGTAEAQRGDKNGSCWQVNVEGTRNLVNAALASKNKIHFIQISTDMVFSGSEEDPGPYDEFHEVGKPSELTWYGITKAEAEKIVTDAFGENATILRLIYPVREKFEGKLDYIRKPLRLYKEGKLYPMFTDQQISIAFIDEVCLALDRILIGRYGGIFHASSSDITTPYELFSFVIEKIYGERGLVRGISLGEFLRKTGTPKFRYPKFGGLKVRLTERKLGIKFSTWKKIVDKLISQGISV